MDIFDEAFNFYIYLVSIYPRKLIETFLNSDSFRIIELVKYV